MSLQLDIVISAGDTTLKLSAEKIAANTRFGIEKALWRSGKDIHKEFNRQVLAKDKSGRLYTRRTRGGAKRRHIASAPGETPANRTGTYRKGFDFSVDRSDQLTIGNTEDHALWLEIGTSRMKKRPGLANAIKASERDIIRNLTGEIEAAI